jgi:hypothetical protein
MDTTYGLAAILRDAAKTPLLRMTAGIVSQVLLQGELTTTL